MKLKQEKLSTEEANRIVKKRDEKMAPLPKDSKENYPEVSSKMEPQT